MQEKEKVQVKMLRLSSYFAVFQAIIIMQIKKNTSHNAIIIFISQNNLLIRSS